MSQQESPALRTGSTPQAPDATLTVVDEDAAGFPAAWRRQRAALYDPYDLPAGAVLTFCRVARPDELPEPPAPGTKSSMVCRHAPVNDPAAAEAAIADLAKNGAGVYIATGVLRDWTVDDNGKRGPRGGKIKRGKWNKGGKRDVLLVTKLDVDLDVASGEHASSDLPTMREAIALMQSAPWGRATVAIDSGGGLHLHYALAEPQDPASPEMRDLYSRWKSWWTLAAAEHGWTIDPTPLTNSAGLLRVAGTASKYGRPVLIKKVAPERRYTLDDFDMLPAPPIVDRPGRTGTGAPLVWVGAVADGSLPLERLARTRGALAALLEAGGLVPQNAAGTLWGYPRPDGTIHEPNIAIYADPVSDEDGADIVERVYGFGSRFNLPSEQGGWGVDGHAWSAAAVLINHWCAGDAGLAARIAHRLGSDPTLIAEAVAGKTPTQLADLYRPAPVVEIVPATEGPQDTDEPVIDDVADSCLDGNSMEDAGWLDEPPFDDPGSDVEPPFDVVERHAVIEGPTGRLTTPTVGTSAVASPTATADVVALDLPRTPLGFAERVAMYEGSVLRCTVVPGEDTRWFKWDGRRWLPTSTVAVRSSIQAVARHIQTFEVAQLGRVTEARARAEFTANPETVPPKRMGGEPTTVDPAVSAARAAAAAAKSLREWASRFESLHAQNDVTAQLSSIRGISVDPDEWDADDDLLNTPSGVINLRTGGRRPHDPKLLMTKITRGSGDDVPEGDDLAAQLSIFARTGADAVMDDDLRARLDALERTRKAGNDAVMSDDLRADLTCFHESAAAKSSGAELVTFLQRWCGSAAHGTAPGALLSVYGESGVGKSTLFEALATALGDYAGFADPGAFKRADRRASGEAPRPGLDRLRGARFALMDEAGGLMLDADLAKRVATGDMTTARALHENGRSWRPQCTATFLGQDPVRAPGHDKGIHRRLAAFGVTVKPEHDDPDIRRRLGCTQEGHDAILAWAIRGARDWLAGGGTREALAIPATVAKATRDQLRSQDPVLQWLDEQTERADPASKSGPSTGAAFASYEAWAHSKGYEGAGNVGTFVRKLRDAGITVTAARERRPYESFSGKCTWVDGITIASGSTF